MINTILPLVLLCMYIGLTYWSFTIIYKVGNDIAAELTHLGMLVITVWILSTVVAATWLVF